MSITQYKSWLYKSFTLVAAILFIGVSGNISASPTINETQILPAPSGAGGNFGLSSFISGDRAIVGASQSNNGAGSAYIYDKDANGIWNRSATLTPSDAAANRNFGYSVSVSGDIAIVGTQVSGAPGNAYIFVKSQNQTLGWVQAAELAPSNSAINDRFGISVNISGNTAIIGAISGGNSAGSVYIFQQDSSGNWNQMARLSPSDGVLTVFGLTVSLSGNTAVVGQLKATYVYVMPPTGWVNATETAKLDAPGSFGSLASIFGDTIVVSDNKPNSNTGAAFIFEKPATGWVSGLSPIATLTPSDPLANNFFGTHSVSISANKVIVPAYNSGAGNQVGTSGPGSAYIFEKPASGWVNATETAKLIPSDGVSGDRFGYSVSISGDVAIVGADLKNGGAGQAYIFNMASGLSVNKTATPSSVMQPGGPVNYGLTITNASGYPITLQALSDNMVSGPLGNCVLPQTIAPTATYACSYTNNVNAAVAPANVVNTVTASATDILGNAITGTGSATVAVTPSPSSIQVTKTPNVTQVTAPSDTVLFTVNVLNTSVIPIKINSLIDNMFGDLNLLSNCNGVNGTVLNGGSNFTCTFSGLVSGSGGQSHTNTITVNAVDSNNIALTGTASAIVNIVAPVSSGCTKTAHNWARHSSKGNKPRYATWDLVLPNAENSPFYLSGKSYIKVLTDPPQGKIYNLLAIRFIATNLNILSGADPSAIQDVFNQAKALFMNNTPANFENFTKDQRKTVLQLREALHKYNVGVIGPGLCKKIKPSDDKDHGDKDHGDKDHDDDDDEHDDE